MKVIDIIEQISDIKSNSLSELRALELSEIERALRRIDWLKSALESIRLRKLNNPEPKASTGKVYTIKEAATELKCDYMTLYKKVRAGKVKSFKIGADWRITGEEIERIKVQGF